MVEDRGDAEIVRRAVVIEAISTHSSQCMGKTLRSKKNGDGFDWASVSTFGQVLKGLKIGRRVSDPSHEEGTVDPGSRPCQNLQSPNQSRIFQLLHQPAETAFVRIRARSPKQELRPRNHPVAIRQPVQKPHFS